MLDRAYMTDRNITIVNPTIRVVVIAAFPYGGRMRQVGEELQVTPTEAQMFGCEGYTRRILGVHRR